MNRSEFLSRLLCSLAGLSLAVVISLLSWLLLVSAGDEVGSTAARLLTIGFLALWGATFAGLVVCLTLRELDSPA